ncbi:MAG: hypothetical protein EOO12_16800 [Chitinophagaceae bacterium]|nr:MAG: hypothetical protein EOO12_16800 [Chitinophagaceae bacterium]
MDHEQEIDDILASLDGAQRAEAGPYFYSRLRARMEGALLPRRLAWRLGLALLLVALLNIVTLRMQYPSDEASAQAIAEDYGLTTMTNTY